jgi:hypothetical protein
MRNAAFIFAMLAVGPALADFNDKKPVTATVTGATPSGYPRTMVEAALAPSCATSTSSAVSFKPNSPGGGVLEIAEGRADFTATATGTEVKLANEGQSPYQKPLKGKFSLAMMLPHNQFIHFLMTKEWADANGIKSQSRASRRRSRRCASPSTGPTTRRPPSAGRTRVMKATASASTTSKWGGSFVLGNNQIGLDAITDGKADVFMNARNLGDSLVKEISSKRPLLWIDGERATIQKAADTFDFKADMVEKGTYAFLDKDYPTVRMWVALLAGAHVADEVVYKYVKAVAENEERVQSIGGSLKTSFTTAKMVVNPSNLPFHPGALRYYREKGLVK